MDEHPAIRVDLTNVLNRPISGSLSVKLGDLTLDSASRKVTLAGGETKSVSFTEVSGSANDANIYPLSVTFDGGADGIATHDEEMHVNVIAHKTITVDGNLDDWAGVLPQPFHSDGTSGPNATLKAWLPFVKFDDTVGVGVSSVYLAYDDSYFYYAAKISDNSPYVGNVRFASRDDDAYYYPDTFYEVVNDKDGNITKSTTMQWPAGVRHYSYRTTPDLPSGGGTDSVQVAFNVIPDGQKRLLMKPSGDHRRSS